METRTTKEKETEKKKRNARHKPIRGKHFECRKEERLGSGTSQKRGPGTVRGGF